MSRAHITWCVPHPVPHRQTATECSKFGWRPTTAARFEDAETLYRLGLDFLCMQETRDRRSYQVTGAKYLAFHSSAAHGKGGCAIWCRRRVGNATLGPKDVAVLASSPEFLFVRVSLNGTSLLLGTGHGPHSDNALHEVEQWWKDFQCALRSLWRQEDLVVLGLDANAQTGSVTSQAIGPHAQQEENGPGEVFRTFLESQGLWAPSTFSSATGECLAVDEAAYTWTSPLGFRHRLDYVVVSDTFCNVHNACTDDGLSFDTAPDHRAAVVTLSIAVPGRRATPTFQRLQQRNASQVRTEICKLSSSLAQATQIPWGVNVHQHVAKLNAQVRSACPRTGPQRRQLKPFLSQSTFELMRSLTSKQATLKGLDEACNKFQLGPFFAAWSGRAHTRLRKCRFARARAVLQVRALQATLRLHLRQDKRRYLCDMADKFAHAVTERDQKALYAALQCLRPTASKGKSKPWGSLQVLLRPDGAPTADFADRQQLFRDTFAKQEGGWQVTAGEYCTTVAVPPTPQAKFDLTDLPTLFQLEDAIHEMADNKAPGPSGIGAGFWKAHPGKAARALLPIVLKSHVRLTEPIQHRGTLVVSLFKQAGSACDPGNYRSIALMDPTAKLAHKLLRPGLIQHLDTLAGPLQQGCQPGSNGIALCHYVTTFAKVANARKQSWAVLFLDLSAAYYRLLRESLHGELDDTALVQTLRRLHIPPSTLQEVRSFVQGTVVLEDASPHLRRMVSALCRGTYFMLEAVPGVTCTSAGSRPGDSVADALFALAAAHLIAEVSDSFRAATDQTVQTPAWADDICWPVAHASATDLLGQLSELAATVHRACMKRAMLPNYKKGKTELLVKLQGKGSTLAKNRLFGQGQARLRFAGHEAELHLGCVQKYKHLGTTITASLRSLPDARRKLGMAVALVSPMVRTVFRRFDVPLAKRSSILSSLALAKAMYGAASWGQMDHSEEANWTAGVIKLARFDRHTRHPTLPGMLEVCSAADWPTPLDLLRMERLSYAATLAASLQSCLWELLQAEACASTHSWWQLATEDVQWLNQMCSGAKGFAPFRDLQHWFDAAVQDAPRCKGWLRKARRAAALRVKQDATARQQAPQETVATAPPGLSSVLACSFCHKVFKKPQQLCVHRANQHAVRPPIEAFAGTRTCRACLVDFRTRKRLIRHLHHDSPECAVTVQTMGCLGPTELHEARTAAALFNSADRASGWSLPEHTLPSFRRPGPLPKRLPVCLDPAVLAVGLELQAEAQCDSLQSFCAVVQENVEVLINASRSSFAFVQDTLPERYSNVLGQVRG